VLESIIRIGAHILVILAIFTIGQFIVGGYKFTWISSFVVNTLNILLKSSPVFLVLWKYTWSFVSNDMMLQAIKTRVQDFFIFTILLQGIVSLMHTFSHNARIREEYARTQRQTGDTHSLQAMSQSRNYFEGITKDITSAIHSSRYGLGISIFISIFTDIAKHLKTLMSRSTDAIMDALNLYSTCVESVTQEGVKIARTIRDEVDIQLYKFTGHDLNKMAEESHRLIVETNNAIQSVKPELYNELEEMCTIIDNEFRQLSDSSSSGVDDNESSAPDYSGVPVPTEQQLVTPPSESSQFVTQPSESLPYGTTQSDTPELRTTRPDTSNSRWPPWGWVSFGSHRRGGRNSLGSSHRYRSKSRSKSRSKARSK
jgi:hypothetical protein